MGEAEAGGRSFTHPGEILVIQDNSASTLTVVFPMTQKMLNQDQYMDIKLLHRQGHSIRAIVVQKHVHQTQAPRVGNDLVTVKGFVLQERLLLSVEAEVVRVGDEIVGGEKKPPVPQAGSAMSLPGSGRTHSTMARMRARGVKY